MSRYEELKKLMNAGKEILPEDETTKANNPRNALAGAVNPLLNEYVNPILPESMALNIPEMTVADEKNFEANLPEQMAGAAMGSINSNPSRFGKILQMGQKEAPKGLGKVTVIDSAADKAMAKLKQAQSVPRNSPAPDMTRLLEEKLGPELAKRKAEVKQGLITDEAFESFKKQEMDALRRRFGL
jgi:hypothetical protein